MSMWIARRGLVVLSMFFLLGGSGLPGARAEDAPQCTVRDRSEAVVLLVCPPGLSREQLRQAGESACGSNALCSAWMWDDAAKAPEKAPPLADGLAKDDILSSIAIWDNDGKQLIMIEQVQN